LLFPLLKSFQLFSDFIKHLSRQNNIIQKTYKHFDSATPQKISNLCQLGQNSYQLEKPFTQTVNCNLQVIVEYFDSDTTGNPILSIRKNMSVSCNLWFSPDFETTVTDKPMNPFELDTYLNKLSQQLSEKLNEKSPKRFPGWFALDFGTSNSTVTLFDPIEVPIAEILPREQELRLRQRLAEWLNSPAASALPDIGASEWEKFIVNISKNLEIEPEQLSEIFESDNKELFLEAIRHLR